MDSFWIVSRDGNARGEKDHLLFDVFELIPQHGVRKILEERRQSRQNFFTFISLVRMIEGGAKQIEQFRIFVSNRFRYTTNPGNDPGNMASHQFDPGLPLDESGYVLKITGQQAVLDGFTRKPVTLEPP